MSDYFPIRVLLIDQEADRLFRFANELSDRDTHVLVAQGCDQAVVVARQQVFDVMLVALPMDESTLTSLLRRIRSRRSLRSVKMLICDPRQTIGVRFSRILGEPMYCVHPSLKIDIIRELIRQTLGVTLPVPKPHLLLEPPQLKVTPMHVN